MLLTLSADSEALNWEEIKENIEHIRQLGIEQFIAVYNKSKDRQDSPFTWGDELEYMVLKLDSSNNVAKVSLRSAELLEVLKNKEQSSEGSVDWQSEAGSWMLEGVPGRPYGQLAKDDKDLVVNFGTIEPNMNLRRQQVESLLSPDEVLLTLTTYPRLGCPDFTSPACDVDPSDASGSLFIPSGAIYTKHRRYISGGENIRSRLGRKVVINVPVFKDANTADPSLEAVVVQDDEAKAGSKPGHIYMDSMMYGMGCCCLQVTVQASNLDQARQIHDNWIALCPIMLALSASSPINRGYLTDHDVRWSAICQSMDDRTKEELGEEPLKLTSHRISKSRYGAVDMYMSPAGQAYNDLKIAYNGGYYDKLVEGGVDAIMAKYIANAFIRDPITIFREELNPSGEDCTTHLDNMLSSSWPMLRFKPPPSGAIGWRVEFRPMEVQFTDFENAAYSTFVILLNRLVETNRLRTIIPMSKIDENMTQAEQRDAVRQSKFWFRPDALEPVLNSSIPVTETYKAMTIHEIVNGDGQQFKGIIPAMKDFLDEAGLDSQSRTKIDSYLKIISDRASGKVLTSAQRVRQFVLDHPDYKGDSVVSDRINYDLMVLINKITKAQD
ncbi:Glutamate--cysteine ligase catalytic subunit [Halotydeus destructor]|nr:Glutamate--cysteine ligase catalytic subunit [Halotydeus destructor]